LGSGATPAAVAAPTPPISFGHNDILDNPADDVDPDVSTREIHSALFAAAIAARLSAKRL